MFTVTASAGNRRVEIAMRGLENAGRRGIRQGFYELGKDLVKQARQNIIKGPKTGVVYKVRGRRRRHRASAAGQPPANLTGTLQKSVGFQLQGSHEMEFGYRDSAPYGVFLEGGTRNMEPRPNLIKVVEGSPKNAREHFTREIAKAHRTLAAGL